MRFGEHFVAWLCTTIIIGCAICCAPAQSDVPLVYVTYLSFLRRPFAWSDRVLFDYTWLSMEVLQCALNAVGKDFFHLRLEGFRGGLQGLVVHGRPQCFLILMRWFDNCQLIGIGLFLFLPFTFNRAHPQPAFRDWFSLHVCMFALLASFLNF